MSEGPILFSFWALLLTLVLCGQQEVSSYLFSHRDYNLFAISTESGRAFYSSFHTSGQCGNEIISVPNFADRLPKMIYFVVQYMFPSLCISSQISIGNCLFLNCY